MNLLLAARLSQARKGQTGIDTQDQDAREDAEREGHTIVGVAIDKVGSRVPPWKRKDLGPWMTDPEKLALYDGILAVKQDRLSRSKWRDEAAIRIWAEDHGKELFIASPKLHWPPRDMAERITWDVLAAQAAQEWDNTSDRYRRAQRYLRENGLLANKAPYGFHIAEMGEHKIIEPDPDTAPNVVEMVERYLSGRTLDEICKWLESEGLKPPQWKAWAGKPKNERGREPRWRQSTISRILRNPVLIGQLKSKGNIVRGKDGQPIQRCEPIVDRDTWDRLQAKLTALPQKRRSSAPADTAMLTGILFCGKCEGPMYRLISTRKHPNGKTYVNIYYRCYGTLRERSKCRMMVPVGDAEQEVNERVMTYGDEPHREKCITPGDDNTLRIAEIGNALAELSKELGTIPFEEYQRKRSELESEYARLASRKPRPRKEEWVYDGRTLGEVWHSWDVKRKREYLLEHGWRFWYHGRDPEGDPDMTHVSRDLISNIAGLSGHSA